MIYSDHGVLKTVHLQQINGIQTFWTRYVYVIEVYERGTFSVKNKGWDFEEEPPRTKLCWIPRVNVKISSNHLQAWLLIMTVNKQTKAQVITIKLSKHVDVTLKYTYSGRNIHLSACSVRTPRFLKFTCTHQKKKFYATKPTRDVIAHVTDMSEKRRKIPA